MPDDLSRDFLEAYSQPNGHLVLIRLCVQRDLFMCVEKVGFAAEIDVNVFELRIVTQFEVVVSTAVRSCSATSKIGAARQRVATADLPFFSPPLHCLHHSLVALISEARV